MADRLLFWAADQRPTATGLRSAKEWSEVRPEFEGVTKMCFAPEPTVRWHGARTPEDSGIMFGTWAQCPRGDAVNHVHLKNIMWCGECEKPSESTVFGLGTT